ncbi:hypothetical protein SCG7086_AJ_00250 [Chlamydiales bacterium SCGC AG-110-P3]|nr:hypothetical protein SCG7086_AJ_00250 [Chlamydiales bacterium SCGC AG-110-P3]
MPTSSPTTKTATKSTYGLAYGAAAVLFWSSGALLFCQLTAIPLLQYIAISQIVGGFTCILLTGGSLGPVALCRRLTSNWISVFLIGTNQLAFATAMRTAPPIHADLIIYLWPAMLVIGSARRLNHAILPQHILGMGLGFLGIFVFLAPEIFNHKIHSAYFSGYLCAFIAALSWTTYSLRGTSATSEGKHAYIGKDVLIIGIVCAALHTIQGEWVALTLYEWIIITTLGIVVYGLAVPCWQKGLQLGRYTTVASLANVIPVLSVTWLIVGGVAPMTMTVAVAGLLISMSCWILQSAPVSPLKQTASAHYT